MEGDISVVSLTGIMNAVTVVSLIYNTDAEFTYPVSRLAVFTILLLIWCTTTERVLRIRHQFACLVMVLLATLAFTATRSLLFAGTWMGKQDHNTLWLNDWTECVQPVNYWRPIYQFIIKEKPWIIHMTRTSVSHLRTYYINVMCPGM